MSFNKLTHYQTWPVQMCAEKRKTHFQNNVWNGLLTPSWQTMMFYLVHILMYISAQKRYLGDCPAKEKCHIHYKTSCN